MGEKKEEDKKEKKYYTPDKSIDVISLTRRRVIENTASRNPNDMLALYYAWMGKINEYPEIFKDINEKLEELMEDTDTSLFNNKRVEPKIWFKYMTIFENAGARIDYSGQIVEKPDYNQGYMDSQIQTVPVYSYSILFQLCRYLFKPGNDNIIVGRKGDGKSNFMLALGLEAIKDDRRFELITNIGIQEWYDHPAIHRNCSWMSDLLRIVCKNRLRNIELLEKGKQDECKYLVCILDECENFISSLRSLSKDVVEFNKFIQLTRKLDLSISMIFHRKEDCPKTFRESPNLNAVIWKGITKEGERLPKPQEKAIIEFIADRFEVWIEGIPQVECLNTQKPSTFSIYDKNFLDKSIDMDDLFGIMREMGDDDRLLAEKLLQYLDERNILNQSFENLINISEKIEEEIRPFIYSCKKESEYLLLARKKFEGHFGILDIGEVPNGEKALKKVINEHYNMYQIEQREKDNDQSTIDYKNGDFEIVKLFLFKNPTRKIKSVVNYDYRHFNYDEVRELLNNKISKQKILALYGHSSKQDLFSKIS